ncbi:CARDB domain-containing protein [Gudongella oleilytica]|uniref:COG1361 S-layer family protein n=1 Tax=Gudongella oleilytica TaxID=1582259 RepID=UPI002A36F39E|nr:CARDB domain-containing protein [Gudongella oleilytica]MDY0257758.1 CARDB domain-containing protein [Gudongella oleilytica]
MKRLLSRLLIFAIIFTLLPAGVWASGDDLPTLASADLIMVNSNTVRAEAGDSERVKIELKNTGEIAAVEIVARLYSDSTGMVYLDRSSYEELSSIGGGSVSSLYFDIEIDERAEDRTYTLDLEVVYYDAETYKKSVLSDTINVRVTSSPTTPELVVSRVDLMPVIVLPGGDFIVGFELENDGDGPARDIKASLKGLSVDTFSLRSGLSTKTLTTINRGKKDYIYFELKATKGLKAGNYELELEYSYKDDKGNRIGPEKEGFSIQVGSNLEQAANLLLQNISYPSGPLGQNKEVKLSMEIRNQGQSIAKNVVVNADSQDSSGLVPKSLSTAKIDAIAPGETVKVEFLFLTAPNAMTSNYPINITVDYTDDLVSPELRDQISQMIGVFVNAPDEDANLSTPKLIIDKYSFSPTMVEAGQNFEMYLSFYNTNSSRAVRNIKIFLTAEEETDSGSVFTPVNSSNTFYIDSIAPKGRVEKTITMFTIPDAKAKTYTITANFEYEDTAANPYQAQEFIGIPVVQQSRLETGEVGYFPESYVGQSTPVSVEFYNTGKVTLYNMMVKLEGDFQTENGQYYVGNFNSGSSEYFEGYVIPMNPGELSGDIVFTFEDSTGQMQEVRKPFTLNVMDMMPMPEYPGGEPPFEEPMPEGSGGIKSFLIPGGVALAAIVAGVIFYRKRKAKKALEEMEIDE